MGAGWLGLRCCSSSESTAFPVRHAKGGGARWSRCLKDTVVGEGLRVNRGSGVLVPCVLLWNECNRAQAFSLFCLWPLQSAQPMTLCGPNQARCFVMNE
eukprot:1160222-Pelagomonas_calceolata.AAC.1